jgi:hypothetical protein
MTTVIFAFPSTAAGPIPESRRILGEPIAPPETMTSLFTLIVALAKPFPAANLLPVVGWHNFRSSKTHLDPSDSHRRARTFSQQFRHLPLGQDMVVRSLDS